VHPGDRKASRDVGIDAAALGGAADPLVDVGEGLRDRPRAVCGLVAQVLERRRKAGMSR
jgi:hypothetical protein